MARLAPICYLGLLITCQAAALCNDPELGDRNCDGNIDSASCRFPLLQHGDYRLEDRNYDGMFDVKISYGWTVIETPVSIEAPVAVSIERLLDIEKQCKVKVEHAERLGKSFEELFLGTGE